MQPLLVAKDGNHWEGDRYGRNGDRYTRVAKDGKPLGDDGFTGRYMSRGFVSGFAH